MDQAKKKLLTQPVDALGLSVRAANGLASYRDPIHTIGDLVEHTGQDLRRRKNFGLKSLKEVEHALAARGLHLRGAGSPPTRLQYKPHPVVMEQLHSLADNGLFGADLHDVVDRLICDRLRELAQDGWLPTTPRLGPRR